MSVTILSFVAGFVCACLVALGMRWVESRPERERALKRHAMRNAVPVTPVAFRVRGRMKLVYLDPSEVQEFRR